MALGAAAGKIGEYGKRVVFNAARLAAVVRA
jgi:hypothetical protein